MITIEVALALPQQAMAVIVQIKTPRGGTRDRSSGSCKVVESLSPAKAITVYDCSLVANIEMQNNQHAITFITNSSESNQAALSISKLHYSV